MVQGVASKYIYTTRFCLYIARNVNSILCITVITFNWKVHGLNFHTQATPKKGWSDHKPLIHLLD